MKTITQFHSIDSFTTDRLIAEKIKHNDLDKFFIMHKNLQLMATLGGVRSEEQTRANFAWNLSQWQDNGFGLWLFYLKTTKEWIGRAGLRRVMVNGHEEIELGYALMPQFWKLGLATEMAKASTEIAFEVIRLDNIVSFTLTTNKTSQRIMEKAGFQYEREIIHADLPHVLYRMKNPRKVEILSYDPHWPDLFEQEARRIKSVLSNQLKEIYHIGSTAIPNMPAKPIIDMMLVCNDLDEIEFIKDKLSSLNYSNLRRQIIPHRSFFVKRQDNHISFNLHIHERGSTQIKRHVNFRDYVIHHPEDAKAYAALKINLAKQFSDDMNSYVMGKDSLVQKIDANAKLWPKRKNDYLKENTETIAKNWSHERLVKAMVTNLNVHMTHFAQYLNQVELVRIPGFTIVNTSLPDDTFNFVLDADFSTAEAQKKILEVTNYFTQKNIPFSWWVSPFDKPDDLPEQLEHNGYQNTENNIAMYFDLDAWEGQVSLPPELEIIQAQDEKTLHDFALVLANDAVAFKQYFSWIASVLTDDDPIEYYVGYVNGKPVVRGLSCYFAQVAGLHWLSTAPDERRKGYGAAMQQYRLKRAKELGYHIAVLQASSAGYPLYQKLGYKGCGVFREFKLKT
ncbi:MAG: GNAT family N-acetyltransferase [Gammaproteobacteria bacterium]|nr:GNAT family N-acetyltransferase [Gammaproteobacteria bacterium]